MKQDIDTENGNNANLSSRNCILSRLNSNRAVVFCVRAIPVMAETSVTLIVDPSGISLCLMAWRLWKTAQGVREKPKLSRTCWLKSLAYSAAIGFLS